MKIGILTLPLGGNYGGIMQNYALQSVLRSEGHEPITLNRENIERRSIFRLYLSYIYLRFFKKGYVAPRKPVTIKRRDDLKRYINPYLDSYVTISKRLTDSKSLFDEVNKQGINALIVGSDQTWRATYPPSICDYFLSFLPIGSGIKRIAYASSFGTDEWEFTEEETEMAKKFIKYFDAISVREESGVKLCKEYLDVDATFALDPTLLLSKDEYLKHLRIKEQGHGKVFAYILDCSEDKHQFAERIAKKLNTTFFEIMPKKTVYDDWKHESDYQLKPVETWLESILGAEFVVTDSFHGAVFSIIFDKPFVVIENKARGTARFDTLKKFVSSYSFVDEKSMGDYQLKVPEIDKHKLEELKRSSLQFLRDALK